MEDIVSLYIKKPSPLPVSAASILRPGAATPYRLVTDGTYMYRKWIQNFNYVIDYSDNGGLTWELAIVSINPSEDSMIMDIDNSPAGYRDLVRAGAYEIDVEITPLGFAGLEGIDWINYYSTKTL